MGLGALDDEELTGLGEGDLLLLASDHLIENGVVVLPVFEILVLVLGQLMPVEPALLILLCLELGYLWLLLLLLHKF